ncbi:MAG: protein kinase [Anaerolineales bacterium]|nr:protein kinase [Anaerolineales bacterium]
MANDGLDHYQLISLIGHGSMSDVHLARHKRLGQHVAIKIIHPHLLDRPGAMKRFEREAAALAAMRHPNIVRVYEYQLEEDQAYIIMEYLGGGTLSARLDQIRMLGEKADIAQVQVWMDSICNAVDFAHSKGLIHRDIKPANILFRENDEVVLTDFGLAYLMDHPRLSPSNAITGTPAYLSPEQAQGDTGDERSDVYSLGIILYEILTGETPFQGNAISIILKHVTEQPPPVRSLNRSVSRDVEAVLMRALAKNPVERYQSAMALSRALEQAIKRSAAPKPPMEAAPATEPPQRKSSPVRATSSSGQAASPRRVVRAAPEPRSAPRPQRRLQLPGILGMFAAIVFVALFAGWVIRGSADSGEAAGYPAEFAVGTTVRITISTGASTSVYATCPGTLVSGFEGVVSDGLTGTIIGRRWCGDGWWYEVDVEEKDLLDWSGVGFVEGVFLERR